MNQLIPELRIQEGFLEGYGTSGVAGPIPDLQPWRILSGDSKESSNQQHQCRLASEESDTSWSLRWPLCPLTPGFGLFIRFPVGSGSHNPVSQASLPGSYCSEHIIGGLELLTQRQDGASCFHLSSKACCRLSVFHSVFAGPCQYLAKCCHCHLVST